MPHIPGCEPCTQKPILKKSVGGTIGLCAATLTCLVAARFGPLSLPPEQMYCHQQLYTDPDDDSTTSVHHRHGCTELRMYV